jgi:hypothetical protein
MNGLMSSVTESVEDVKNQNMDLYDGVVAVYFSSPLVAVGDDGEVKPIDNFSLDREYDHWSRVFEYDTKILMERIVGRRSNWDNIQQYHSVLHFACPVQGEYVYLEEKRGKADLIPIHEIKLWAENQRNLRLVVLADYDSSHQLENIFLAVAPHVVRCSVLPYKLDDAMLLFCESFYTALAKSTSVQRAYDDACAAVRNSAHLSYTGHDNRQVTSRFQLLPENENHDEVIFEPRSDFEKIKATIPPKLRILPQPPPVFVGRQSCIHHVLNHLESARLIRVVGEYGSGAFIKSVCQFMERRPDEFLHEVVWLPPRLGCVDEVTSTCRTVFDAITNLEEPEEHDIGMLLKLLKERKILLICDIREWGDAKDVFHSLMDLLDEIFDITPKTKAILIHNEISTESITLSSSYIEETLRMNPLGYSSTVCLFALLCPHVSKRTSTSIGIVHDLKALLIPDAGYVGNTNLKMTLVKIYNLLGAGDPVQIRQLALSMTEEEYHSLLEVGKLRLKLSRLYQKQIEMTFPTRYSLDLHLEELSDAMEEARSEGKVVELQALENKYNELGRRRHELSSIDVMLIKRKALKTDLKMLKLSGHSEQTHTIAQDLTRIEATIKKERNAMIQENDDWIRVTYAEYPAGISRRTLELRLQAKEHLWKDACKTKDYHLVRQLEYPIKELRECRLLLPEVKEWTIQSQHLLDDLKEAEAIGDVNKIVNLHDKIAEIERRLADENGDVKAERIAEDLFLSLDAFLRYTGVDIMAGLPVFETIESRFEAESCLQTIKEKAWNSSDDRDIDRFNSLFGLYKEVCHIIQTKLPSIDALLVERSGLLLEKTLLFSEEKEIVKDCEIEIEAIEEAIRRERRQDRQSEYFGVCKEFYYHGITRNLVEKRIHNLQQLLDQANDSDDIFDIAELEVRIAELEKHKERLPVASEIAALIGKVKRDTEHLSKRPGNDSRIKMMKLAMQNLERRWRAESIPKNRPETEKSDELFIPQLDYFHPPMTDSISEIEDQEFIVDGTNCSIDEELSTVEENSQEDDNPSDDDLNLF